ncbi:MAG: class I SAM-dependent methyltransferase [Myxococcota bacterium]|nr:class I SAM-dependent methyltransferase [Myxococcota bacterium]
MPDHDDRRRSSPAAQRNREPLLEVLTRVLPAPADCERPIVLEIASGSGEHAVFFAPRLPHLDWQPSDADPSARASIEAWRELEPSANLRASLAIDVCDDAWPIARADAMVCINMIHASPWESTPGLMRGAARTLNRDGAPLVLYGAYRIGGAHTSPSNIEFDAWLKDRDPRWGVRDLERVLEVAAEHGLAHDETIEMPANNLVVVLRRRGGTIRGESA